MSERAKKRKSLSLSQKLDIIRKIEANPLQRKAVIAEELGIPFTTLCNIWRDRQKYVNNVASGTQDLSRKRSRASKLETVDDNLLQWFSDARSQGVPINGPVLKTKAEEFAASLGSDGWTCGNGWLDRWKRRHSIVFKTMSGERASVDEAKTDQWVEEVLLPTLEKYEEKDVYNADETGLFWRLLPDKTFTFKKEKCRGQKKSKDRVTVLLCCNMDGSDKRRPLLIGKFANPRCFKNVKRLPVDYKSNYSAWMTSAIFCEWLLSFDRDMQMQRRKVLLVMDNCSAHKIPEQPLKAVQVLFLPANSTAKLQPCDTGIIRNLKVHYRRMMVLGMLAQIDGGVKAKEQRPEFDLRDAVNMIDQSWQKVTPTTISNSFRHAGFQLGSEDRPQEPVPAASYEEQEPLLTRLSKEWGISLEEYVSVDDHLPTTEPPTFSASATSTSASNVAEAGATDSSEEDEASEKEAERVSIGEVLGYVRQINLYCLQAGCGDAVTNSFHVFNDLLMKHIVNARHQTQIRDFFTSTSSDNLNCREDKDSEGFKTSGGEDGDDRSEGGKAGNTETGGNWEKEKAGETKEREMKEKSGGENAGNKDEETETRRETEGRKRKKTENDSERSGGKDGWFGRKGEGHGGGTKDDSDLREDDFIEREKEKSMQTPRKKRRDGEEAHRGGDKGCRSECGGVGGREEWGSGWNRPAEGETGKNEGERLQGKREDDNGNGGNNCNVEENSDEARKEDDAYTCKITRVQNPEPDQFHPTNKHWRKEQCSRLGFPYPIDLPDREIKQQLRPPSQVENIVGDGNCLYRALSFELCGTQDKHGRLKEILIDFMLENQKTFAGYVGGDLASYLTKNTMQARAWGSDVEIFAAATLLQTTVVVYTAITPSSRKWLSHTPLFRIPDVPRFVEKIYLRNLCGHFERVSSTV